VLFPVVNLRGGFGRLFLAIYAPAFFDATTPAEAAPRARAPAETRGALPGNRASL
jgi:hypothetical protein